MSEHLLNADAARWLHHEVGRWIGTGLIDAAQGEAILSGYPAADGVPDARAQRGMFLLQALAALMAAAGVLLVIGYNWHAIARGLKVALIFGSVIAAYAAAAGAFARGRHAFGQIALFAATLLYGNAIWLLGQVFHLSGTGADAALWWLVGALVPAWLLRSRPVAVECGALLVMWTLADFVAHGTGAGGSWLFLVLAAAFIWTTYRVNGPGLLAWLGPATVIWLVGFAWHIMPLVGLAGCVMIAAAVVNEGERSFALVWRSMGLLLLLASLVFLSVVRSGVLIVVPAPARVELVVLVIAATIFAGAVFATRSDRSSLVLAAAVGLLAVRALLPLVPSLGRDPMRVGECFRTGACGPLATPSALVFSALIVALAIWLVRRGAIEDRAIDFFGGVLYAIAFVLARWVSLLGNMLSSSMVLFGAAAVFVATVHVWRRRQRVSVTEAFSQVRGASVQARAGARAIGEPRETARG